MQPVTTISAPSALRSARPRTTSIDSWRASSMKAQVLTTTRSASSAAPAAVIPSARNVPTSLSESTWFFGQPSVSTKNVRRRSDMAQRVLVGPFATRTLALCDANRHRDARHMGRTGGDEMVDVPETTLDADAAFVTAALRSSGTIGTGTSVAEVEHDTIGEGVGIVGQLARLQLRYDGPGGRRTGHGHPQDPVAVPGEPGRRRPLQLLRARRPLLRAARRQGARPHGRLLLEPHRPDAPAASGCSSRISATAR